MSMTETVVALMAVLRSDWLSINTNMAPTAWNYPANFTLTDGSYFDFIVVGSGTAGSVMASRLSESGDHTVLLIEAGGYHPMEAEKAGMFPLLPMSDYDFQMVSQNDGYTSQNLNDQVTWLTQGKMLGGSSNNNHMIYVQGDPHDFDNWATLLDDDSLSYANVMPYFLKQENLQDADLLDSSFADLHGTDGPIKITRQTSTSNANYLAAIAEAGWNVVNDTSSATSTLGFTEPLFTIYGERQSNSYGYLSPAKDRSNLKVALSTTVTKILIDECDIAIGVEVLLASGETYKLYVNNEVIVSAGAINTPKLLMLSGIGPSDHLTSLNIDVVADLPVGQNLMDHPGTVLFYQLEEYDSTTPAVNYNLFPVPTMTGYVALDDSQTYPDYQDIMLIFPHDSTALIQLCSNVFQYNNDICDALYAASAGRTTLFSVHNLMQPKSRGEVLLASADYSDDPLVYTKYLSDSDDLSLMAETCAHFNSTLLGTSYFQEISATFVNPGVCSDVSSDDFWTCYAENMTGTMWHYSGTCAMGSVVDTSYNVKGIDGLRVVDASVMPTLTSGNINAAVNMLAERAAAIVLAAWSS